MGSTAPSTRAGDEEQSLQQAIKNVKSNAVEMRRALVSHSIPISQPAQTREGGVSEAKGGRRRRRA